MRRLSYSLSIFMLLGVIALVFPVAAVWSTEIYQFNGKSAFALWSSIDPSDCDCNVDLSCIQTDVAVFGFESIEHTPPGPRNSSTSAQVIINQFDICSDTALVNFFCASLLTDQDFQVSTKLDSATLNTHTPLDCGDSVTASVDITWKGTDGPNKGINNSHVSYPGCIMNSHSIGISVPSQASGSVTIETTNYTPDPTDFAFINSGKGSIMSIGCQ